MSFAGANEPLELTALELFAGIGGLHYALLRTRLKHRVVQSYDVCDAAVKTYRHNLGHTPSSSVDICGVSVDQLSRLRANAWLLSPPCQPFTRQAKSFTEQREDA